MADVKVGPVHAPIVPLVIIGIGMYLAFFGVHYWRSDVKWPSDPVKNVLQGKGLPSTGTQVTTQDILTADVLSASGSGGGSTATQNLTTGSSIADDALKYSGKGYVWGGPADVPGNWDCSSFVSYVLGHDLGLPLPGGGHYGDGGYPPHTHGPTTLQYMLYGTGVNFGQEQPGDLVVSTVHMGIVIGNGQMISAQDPQSGTGVGGYRTGFPGGTPLVRRVGAVGPDTAGNNVVSGTNRHGLGGGAG